MSLIEKVIEMRSSARSASNMAALSILTLLYGEIETNTTRSGRKISEASDEDVLAVIKKMIKANSEVISLVTEDRAEKFVEENKILSKFLPIQMTSAEIESALVEITFGSVGEAVKALDSKYAGCYDKAFACRIAKSML